MAVLGPPILATLALWWASTGAIMYVDGLDRGTFGRTMIGASALLAIALWATAASAASTTAGAAYAAFAAGVVCWAWQLVAFYTGFITGPRKSPRSPGRRGWGVFFEALGTSLYHEIFAALGAVVLLALTGDEPNRLALWTYVALWAMHASAKLNVFFGVPNLGEEMLPEHLVYLKSYMTRRPMNLFFPVSVTILTLIAARVAQTALAPAATASEAAGATMLAALMALGILEHWFLVAPVDGNALWRVFAKGAASESWSAEAPAMCDAKDLALMLEKIAQGAFGEVESVEGFVRTRADWVRFELSGRKARMSPFAPQGAQSPSLTAIGRRLDRLQLQAALDGCAVAA